MTRDEEGDLENNMARFHGLMRESGATLVSTDPYERWKVTVTPQVAESLLKLSDTFQRPLSEDTVRAYARAQSRGEWMPCVDPLMITSEQWTMLDGQHRCASIKKSGLAQQFEVVVRPRSTIVPLDQRKPRSVSATDSAINQRAPLNSRVQSAVEIATFGPSPILRPSRLERGCARDAFSKESLSFVAELSAKKMVRLPAPVLAVAIMAHEKHPEQARLFFGAMTQNSAVVMGREWAVLRYMCARILGIRSATEGDEERRKRSPGGGSVRRELYVRTANAWNAFVAGRDITHTKYSVDGPVPDID